MKNKVLILAPHVDDELIGCFRQLEAGAVHAVAWFHDLTNHRIAEAHGVAKYYGFQPLFQPTFEDLLVVAKNVGTVLAPNVSDAHPHHKEANRLAKRLCVMSGGVVHAKYYSVDMVGRFDVLQPEEQAKKKNILSAMYPTQSLLLENEKYHLFEALAESDYSETLQYRAAGFLVRVTGCASVFRHPKYVLGEIGRWDDSAELLDRMIVEYAGAADKIVVEDNLGNTLEYSHG